MCTVLHLLLPHAHHVLPIQSTVQHSLSMHKRLKCILPPTPLWCSDHVLDINIWVANISRLTMRGHSSSDNRTTVVRNGSVGFSFKNMVDFNVYSLAFTSCKRSWDPSSRPASNSALLLQSTANAKLVNCTFHDNLGDALTVGNTSITLVENNEFVRNICSARWSHICQR